MTPEQQDAFLASHPQISDWLFLKQLEANTAPPTASTTPPVDPLSVSPSLSSSDSQGTASSADPSSPSETGDTTANATPDNFSPTGSTPLSMTLGNYSATTGSTPSSTTPGTTPSTTGTGSTTHREKWSQMTPEQKEAFLRNHPAIAEKFAQTHSDAEERLAQMNEARPGIHDPGHRWLSELNGREALQLRRFAQGLSSGKLPPQQLAQLQRIGNRIQKQEGNDLARNDGHPTPAERVRLNWEENRLSHRIYQDRHEQNHGREQNH